MRRARCAVLLSWRNNPRQRKAPRPAAHLGQRGPRHARGTNVRTRAAGCRHRAAAAATGHARHAVRLPARRTKTNRKKKKKERKKQAKDNRGERKCTLLQSSRKTDGGKEITGKNGTARAAGQMARIPSDAWRKKGSQNAANAVDNVVTAWSVRASLSSRAVVQRRQETKLSPLCSRRRVIAHKRMRMEPPDALYGSGRP